MLEEGDLQFVWFCFILATGISPYSKPTPLVFLVEKLSKLQSDNVLLALFTFLFSSILISSLLQLHRKNIRHHVLYVSQQPMSKFML